MEELIIKAVVEHGEDQVIRIISSIPGTQPAITFMQLMVVGDIARACKWIRYSNGSIERSL